VAVGGGVGVAVAVWVVVGAGVSVAVLVGAAVGVDVLVGVSDGGVVGVAGLRNSTLSGALLIESPSSRIASTESTCCPSGSPPDTVTDHVPSSAAVPEPMSEPWS
jgi:hypothetical protein